MTDVLMPALSPTMEEGTLSKWHVKAGDTVASGDVIAEIETDKASMEVEAVDEGVITAILVPEGTEGVKVNTPIARMKGEGRIRTRRAPADPARGCRKQGARAGRRVRRPLRSPRPGPGGGPRTHGRPLRQVAFNPVSTPFEVGFSPCAAPLQPPCSRLPAPR